MTLSAAVMEEAIHYAITCAAWHATLGALSGLALLALYYLTLSLAAFGLGLFGHAYADWHLWGMEWWRW